VCNYCGCRAFPLIGRLTDEHEAIADAAGELRTAIVARRHDEAIRLLDQVIGLLIPHTTTEEQGLFAELRFDPVLAEEVDKLCREHADIHGVLAAVDRTVPDWSAVLAAIDRLYRHIDNEEHGLFPAAVIALPIAAWDRITPATQPAPSVS
jgi:Hemerythrin HHE cation binding domain